MTEATTASVPRIGDTGTQYTSRLLAIETHHPFFFDHPLDHVPGLLLIDGMLRLSRTLAERSAAASSLWLRSLDIEFSRFCLLHAPVELRCQHIDSPNRSYLVEVWQDGEPRARGRYNWKTAESSSAPSLPSTGVRTDEAEPALPCDRRLVGKSNPDNVMISHPWSLEGQMHARIVPPHPGNALVDTSAGTYSPLYLLESFMQTQRYLNQMSSAKKPMARMRDTLVGVSIQQFARIPIGTRIGIVRPPADIAIAAGRRRQAGQITAWHVDADKPLQPIQPLAECVVRTLSTD